MDKKVNGNVKVKLVEKAFRLSAAADKFEKLYKAARAEAIEAGVTVDLYEGGAVGERKTPSEFALKTSQIVEDLKSGKASIEVFVTKIVKSFDADAVKLLFGDDAVTETKKPAVLTFTPSKPLVAAVQEALEPQVPLVEEVQVSAATAAA